MTDKSVSSVVDSDDIGHNDSTNQSFDNVLSGFLSRRHVLRGGVGSAAAIFMGGALAACGDSTKPPAVQPAPPPPPVPPPPPPPAPKVLGLNFNPVAHSITDALVVPEGYTATVLYSLGDPLNAGTPDYLNDGSETGASFEFRAGDHHDGMAWYGLSETGAPSATSNTRGLIAINHENITPVYLHPNGWTAAPRPANEALKEINCHGVAVFEVAKGDSGWSVVRSSAFNRRITPNTWMDFSGPAAGHASLVTLNAADGRSSRGTLNNCASGTTPWGTYLTCEENWAGYFHRDAGDNGARTSKEVLSFNRYGVAASATSGSYRWETAVSAEPGDRTFRRWDATVSGPSAADDFRNEPNTFGWVVEINPYDPVARPVKRTALGRFAHEATAYSAPVEGKPLAFYMGDDARGEYMFKFVSAANWSAADFNAGPAAGDKYLDSGTLYAARFDEDGTGEWLPLTLANPQIAGYGAFDFADEAEILIHSRVAADAAGATKMDRPEWTAVNPKNGDVYLTLTNNNSAFRPVSGVDAANPRAYGSGGNANGHIVRLAETGGEPGATTFEWDVYLFGAPFDADPHNINVSGLTELNDFSSPDGIWFDTQGVCWIQTDDGAYTPPAGRSNCMMLAAIPGSVGDGDRKTISNTVGGATSEVTTPVAAAHTEENLRRFLVSPYGAEVTGITATPDLKTLFINIQHPGEVYPGAGTPVPVPPPSTWPGPVNGNGLADGLSRPRSATVVITKDDGGTVGGTLA